MPTYRVDEDAVKQARKLIDDREVDVDTEWSGDAPSADDGDAEIEKHGYEGYAAWHLVIDLDVAEETKGRHTFPYGDFSKVNRAARIPASNARRRTAMTPSRRRSADCCSAWTRNGPSAWTFTWS
jgi:hypothetical protein